ncbi:DUF742 domain-containing protein [Streptomyces populi]
MTFLATPSVGADVTSSRDDTYGTGRNGLAVPRGSRSDASPRRSAKPSALVRPYAMTGGRTRPVHQLAVEALVSTTGDFLQASKLSPEAYRICILCREINSVAEISALLSIPLGVTRILVADLVELGFVVVQHSHVDGTQDGRPEVTLLEKVLIGLRNLQ